MAAPRNKVRIIGGEWRSRRIAFPSVEDLRPTPDRVRVTLFNWLGQDLTGKTCLDLFAGSGALGFEAASRGAQRVVMVERDAQAFSALQANRVALGAGTVELKRMDALEFLHADAGAYDVVFLDPPFRSELLTDVFPLLISRLAPGALVHVEAPQAHAAAPDLEVWRSGKAGAVIHQLLKRSSNES